MKQIIIENSSQFIESIKRERASEYKRTGLASEDIEKIEEEEN